MAWPPPSPTIERQSGSPSTMRSQLDEVEGLDEVDAGHAAARQRRLESRPQVGHRHHEIGPRQDQRELLDEAAPEDGRELVAGVSGWGCHRLTRQGDLGQAAWDIRVQASPPSDGFGEELTGHHERRGRQRIGQVQL